MRLVHGVGIVLTELLHDLLDSLVFSLEDGIADDFLEPRVMSRVSLFATLDVEISSRRTLKPPAFACRRAYR